jgi:hypothetical protein
MKTKTNKELLIAFREQFNTGYLLNEGQVLVLMGYARGEGRKETANELPVKGARVQFECEYTGIECPHLDLSGMDKLIDCKECDLNPCIHCGHKNEEICNTCTIINRK